MINKGWYKTRDGKVHVLEHLHNKKYNYSIHNKKEIVEVFVPEGALDLFCPSCSITTIHIPSTLLTLGCWDNEIKELTLSPKLQTLMIDQNQINEITLPNTIKKVICDIETKITNIKDFINTNANIRYI